MKEAPQTSHQALKDINNAATYLDDSVRHLRRLVDERRIPYLKVGGSATHIARPRPTRTPRQRCRGTFRRPFAREVARMGHDVPLSHPSAAHNRR